MLAKSQNFNNYFTSTNKNNTQTRTRTHADMHARTPERTHARAHTHTRPHARVYESMEKSHVVYYMKITIKLVVNIPLRYSAIVCMLLILNLLFTWLTLAASGIFCCCCRAYIKYLRTSLQKFVIFQV